MFQKFGANKTKCTFVNFCISFDVLMLIVFLEGFCLWRSFLSGDCSLFVQNILCLHRFSLPPPLNPPHLCRGSTIELFHKPAVFDIRPWNYKCFIKVGIFFFVVLYHCRQYFLFFIIIIIIIIIFEYLKSSGTQHAVPNCLVICEYFE